MPNYCSIIVAGHLTKDPELRTSQGGTDLCNAGIAWNSGAVENKKANFLDITLFGDTAKRFADWMHKGNAVLVAGRLQQETWTDKESGKTRSKHSMIVDRFENLTPREEGGEKPAPKNYTRKDPRDAGAGAPEIPF